MRRCQLLFLLLASIAALAFRSTPAAAQAGVNLAWDDCLAGGGIGLRTFACNSNSGSQALVATVMPPPGVDHWVSFEWYLGFQFSTPQMPQWWAVRGTGQCRNGALTASPDPTGLTGCADAYQGNAGGGIGSYTLGYGGLNRARLFGVYAVPQEFEAALDPQTEYFVVKIPISNAKTVGTTCTGCGAAACIGVESISVVQPAGAPGGDTRISNPIIRSFVFWQGGSISDCGCSFGSTKVAPPECACASKNVTWGRVKAVYR